MSWFPKPKVRIFAPSPIFSGSHVDVDVELECEEEIRISYVEAELLGQQGWSVGSGNHRISHSAIDPFLKARLLGRGVLKTGITKLRAVFDVPQWMPPTHGVSPAYSYLELKFHVSIPWWPDGRYRYTLPVRLPPPPEVVRAPGAFRSPAAAGSPRLEVSLASTRLVAGEVAVGSVALFHVDDKSPRPVTVVFQPVLRLVGRGRERWRDGTGFSYEVTVPAGGAGTSVPFRVQLPAEMTPTFRSLTHELSWQLYARSGSLFTKKVELSVPLEIFDQAAIASTERLALAPRLADERVAIVLEHFAASTGWHALDDTRTGHVQVAKQTEHGNLHIAYDYRGQRGTFLVSRISSPSLGLGLEVIPSSSLRHVFFHDIEVDITAWDKANLVRARSEEQAVPALRHVVSAMVISPQLGTLVRWTDDELVLELKIEDVKLTEMTVMAQQLENVARAIDLSRAMIPPPAQVTIDHAAWSELAKSWHGHLALGDLSIDGMLDKTLPVRVGLQFDEHQVPTALHALVGHPDHASDAVRQITINLAHPADDALALDRAEIASMVAAWPKDIVQLHVEDGIASASWKLPSTPTLDAERVRDLVMSLRTLLLALSPDTGPYR